MKHKTQKWPKPKIERSRHYNCAYVRVMAILIIFPVILQADINTIILSFGEQGVSGASSFTLPTSPNLNYIC